ncbi:MAG: hypothetical protein H6587_00260 [Flavobacteriales bacterium]|nr:hypothetical protein [Flavobacteriales bacterium]MCB9362977.1 hypothetical protein [Flavobacteriales bacterium]
MKKTILVFLFFLSLKSFSQENKKYQIGDFAHGGIIFWLDESGQHGLVCTKSDIAQSTQWDTELEYVGEPMYPPERDTKSVAIADGIYAGKENTQSIIDFVGKSDMPCAALICDEYKLLVDTIMYDDWYLPSREELNIIYLNRTVINETAIQKGGDSLNKKRYWSSTDVNCNEEPYNKFDKVHLAYGHDFSLGSKKYQLPSKKYMPYSVRAIRSF